MSVIAQSNEAHLSPTHLSSLELPSSTHELVRLFETSSEHLTRVCALAKIKNQILTAFPTLTENQPEPQISGTVETLFSNTIIKFLKKEHYRTEHDQIEVRFFIHVASLVIKYFYREEAFLSLLSEITNLLDGYNERVRPCLELFTEIITTIEYQTSENGSKPIRCHFERHLTSRHINSMLLLANFCLEKGVLREDQALEDNPAEDSFKFRSPEETLTAALKLLRATLCFDWLGEKYSDFEQKSELTSIIIPTKGSRQTPLTQFQKWLRNCEWIRLYQFLFLKSQSLPIKLQVIEVLGDLTRIHMKYFKNKNTFRIHIQNIIYALSSILDELQLNRKSEETIQLAIAFGRNLNKLMIGGVGPIFFEVNPSFYKGLLDSIKNFIVGQVINQQIFNVNIIFYFFKFLEMVLTRSNFQKSDAPFKAVEERLRQICRNYENYFRLLIVKVTKAPIRESEAKYYRLDCSKLKESIQYYDWKELQIYFLPFRLMIPRYASTNTIYELFIYISAKVTRAYSILDTFKLEEWERNIAYNIIVQSINKLNEWFGYTTFRKRWNHNRHKHSEGGSSDASLPPIDQRYEQEIQNEEEYCHILRLTVFLLIDQLVDKNSYTLIKLKQVVPSLKLIILALDLCLSADLQQADSTQRKNQAAMFKIVEGLSMCLQLCKKILLRQFEFMLYQSFKTNNKRLLIRYDFTFEEASISFLQEHSENEKVYLLEFISNLIENSSKQIKVILAQMQFLLSCSLIPLRDQESCIVAVESMEMCEIYLQNLRSFEILVLLCRQNHPQFTKFLRNTLQFLGNAMHKQGEFVSYLRCLRIIGELNINQINEEATNKLYVSLKCFLGTLKPGTNLSEQLETQLKLLLAGILSSNREFDLKLLHDELQKAINPIIIHVSQPMDIETNDVSTIKTCFSPAPMELKQRSQTIKKFGLQNQAKSQQLQKSEPSKNSQYTKLSNEVKINQDLSEQKEVQIYVGYHRQKILSILDKYISPSQQRLEQQKHLKQQHQNDEQPHQTHQTNSNEEETAEQIQHDNRIVDEPFSDQIIGQPQNFYPQQSHLKMDIEEPKNNHQHDYIDTINRIVQSNHLHLFPKPGFGNTACSIMPEIQENSLNYPQANEADIDDNSMYIKKANEEDIEAEMLSQNLREGEINNVKEYNSPSKQAIKQSDPINTQYLAHDFAINTELQLSISNEKPQDEEATVSYIKKVNLEDEDSTSPKQKDQSLRQQWQPCNEQQILDIQVSIETNENTRLQEKRMPQDSNQTSLEQQHTPPQQCAVQTSELIDKAPFLNSSPVQSKGQTKQL